MSYRIKHILSGLYYTPTRKVRVKLADGTTAYVKSNLSKQGKVYATRPSLKHIRYYSDHTKVSSRPAYGRERVLPSDYSLWTIEEVGKSSAPVPVRLVHTDTSSALYVNGKLVLNKSGGIKPDDILRALGFDFQTVQLSNEELDQLYNDGRWPEESF